WCCSAASGRPRAPSSERSPSWASRRWSGAITCRSTPACSAFWSSCCCCSFPTGSFPSGAACAHCGLAMAELMQLDAVSRRFGGLQALDRVTLDIGRGEILGLIGPKGAGKTTLVNVVTGVHRATGGRIRFEGRDTTAFRPYQAARAGIARTFQVVQPFPELSVHENVTAAALFCGAN